MKKTLGIESGDEGIRTPDLCVANAALSQLSYIPTKRNTQIPDCKASVNGNIVELRFYNEKYFERLLEHGAL